METEVEAIQGAEATAVAVATTATAPTPPDSLKGGGAASGGQGMGGGGEGKGKGKGSAEEGKGSGQVAVAPLGKKHGAGVLGVAGGSAATERYNWIPSLRESNPSRECMRRVRKDIRTLMR